MFRSVPDIAPARQLISMSLRKVGAADATGAKAKNGNPTIEFSRVPPVASMGGNASRAVRVCTMVSFKVVMKTCWHTVCAALLATSMELWFRFCANGSKVRRVDL